VRNRTYLRRFSDCQFAQFVSICFSGSGQCGHNSAAFAAQYSIICSEIAGQRVVRAFCFRTVRPPIRLATPPVRDEVALFSAARHSGIPETKATVTPRAFGCGCAALRNICCDFVGHGGQSGSHGAVNPCKRTQSNNHGVCDRRSNQVTPWRETHERIAVMGRAFSPWIE